MLHSRFAQLDLETDKDKRCFQSAKMASEVGERDNKKDVIDLEVHKREIFKNNFVIPGVSAKSKAISPRKLRVVASPLKKSYLQPPPAPRSSMNSDSRYSSSSVSPILAKDSPAIFVKNLSERLEMLKESKEQMQGKEARTSSVNSPRSGMEMVLNSSLPTNNLMQRGESACPQMSVELRKLCSGSSLSAFNSDSDNSSCMFANTSYMSSTDFADDVFPDAKETSPVKSPSKSDFLHDSLCQDVSIEFAEKEKPEVFKGAAIIGSPSKIRHQSSRSIRRVKSSSALSLSCRYAPYILSPRKSPQAHATSGRRWYKSKTDPYLPDYEDPKRDQKDLESEVVLPKRALRFDDHDSESFQAQSKKLPSPHLPQVVRTDTPESGYGSFNTTQQTPELSQNLTPVSSNKVSQKVQCSEPPLESYCTPRAPPSRTINTGPIPWLEKFDVVTRLCKVEPSIVDHILSYLVPAELVLFSSVSTRWRNICSSLPVRASLRDAFLEDQRQKFLSKKENFPLSSRAEQQSLTRPGTPLAPVQRLGRPTAESTPLRQSSSINKFHEVGQKLPQGQSLDKCKCGSPARVEVTTRRAQCSSIHCQREFCVKCRMGYHGNSPCSPFTGRGRPRGPSVGSRSSKRNLRRHSRLSSTDG